MDLPLRFFHFFCGTSRDHQPAYENLVQWAWFWHQWQHDTSGCRLTSIHLRPSILPLGAWRISKVSCDARFCLQFLSCALLYTWSVAPSRKRCEFGFSLIDLKQENRRFSWVLNIPVLFAGWLCCMHLVTSPARLSPSAETQLCCWDAGCCANDLGRLCESHAGCDAVFFLVRSLQENNGGINESDVNRIGNMQGNMVWQVQNRTLQPHADTRAVPAGSWLVGHLAPVTQRFLFGEVK